MLHNLREAFEIKVERFDRQRTTLWESTLAQSPALPGSINAWIPERFENATQLGAALAIGAQASSINASDSSNTKSTTDAKGVSKDAVVPEESRAAAGAQDAPLEASQQSNETVVLFTDGRNTGGASPLAVAESMARQHRPIYIVGFGGTEVPDDISVLAVEHPERVFERDMLRGTIVLRQRMQKPEPLRVMVKLDGETIWEETRTISTEDRGRIEFAFPIKPVAEKLKKQAGRAVEFTSMPVHLEAVVEPQTGEADIQNNSRAFHVSVVTKRSRLLLVDGRSRWETRYLHNMFERDPAWQVDIVLPDYRESPPRLPRGTETNQWPSTKERLFEYDLVILGELPAALLPREGIEWLNAFVETSGGGLIVVDGARGALRDPLYAPLHAMLPIEWLDDKRIKPDPSTVHLTSTSRQLSVFQLTPSDPAKNDAAWAELPAVHTSTSVKALPGSEVLATATQEGEEVPLMVTRQFGAGRIFYCGTDETWRWRYKVADTYHQRFWNQVARWVMRLPMSVQGQFVSIDSGKLVYQPGETITIRTRLRGSNGEPANGLAVEAIVTEVNEPGNAQTKTSGPASVDAASNRDTGSDRSDELSNAEGRVLAVIPLVADSAIQGVYSGQLVAPASGNYQVSIVAPGLASSALAIHSEFSVSEADSGEMDQLNCDEPLLRKLAEITGGQYFSEQEASQLVDLLRPLSRGRIVESDTLLWQSYWWFAPIVLLLTIEWWLRKRAGLI